MVGPAVGTLTALCPAVRTFGEHFFLVIADDLRTVSGLSALTSGHRPCSQKAHSPTPIEPTQPWATVSPRCVMSMWNSTSKLRESFLNVDRVGS
jgi:hypothetical protein